MKYEDIPPNSYIYYLMQDTLQDTRMGTLMRLDPRFAITATASKEYETRQSDDLTDVIKVKGFDQKAFEQLYYLRDKSTLFYSMQTAFVSHLKLSMAEVALARANGDPRVKDIVVFINCYPYDLDETDAHYLRQVLAHAFEIPIDRICIESRSLRDMNVAWLQALKPDLLAVYDLKEWLREMGLPTTREAYSALMGSPDTICITPGLLLDRHQLKLLKQMDLSGLSDKDPYSISRKALSNLFSLEVMPAKLFNVQRYVSMEKPMSNIQELFDQVQTMNQIAGRRCENNPTALVGQFEQIAEEFRESLEGLVTGLQTGDWNEFRNGLGDMVVVIWGEASVAQIPMLDDLSKIMAKNLSKFDTDYTTAQASLQAMQDKGYQCEIRETNVNGQVYYPILTTAAGVVYNADGTKTPYNANKFLKSVLWSEEEFTPAPTLPQTSSVSDKERLALLVESLVERLSAVGMALRESIKE